MSPLQKEISVLLSIVLIAMGRGRNANSAPITWIGGNANWDGISVGKWNPADEPDDNDEAIFNTPNSVDLANAAEGIQALTMSGGIDLDLNGNDMTVDGLVELSGSSTNLIVGGAGALLTADSVDVNADASLVISGGSITIIEETGAGSLDVLAGGVLRGNGVIILGDGAAAPTDLLNLTGTLSASSTGLIIIGEPPAGTLTIHVNDVDGRVDLDQSGNAVVNAFRNQTLEINGTLSDAFSADMNLFHNSTVDIRDPWSLDAGATLDVDNGFVPGSMFPFIPTIPADTSFISGGAFTQTGGMITVVDTDGTLQFNAAFTQTGGTLTNNGLVVFNANATIAAGATFNMTTSSSSLTVNSGVTVNVDQANFNPDGSAAATNVITVNSGGILDFDLGAGADEGFGGAIVLNGGELDVTTASNTWSIDRTVNVGASTGTSQINGEQVTIASATITVGANSTLDVNADAVWGATGNLVTNAGAVTRLDGTTNFNGNGTFTGAGTLRTGGNTAFGVVTTINMPSGTVDLDGGDLVANTVTINANTTINAGTMASFGAFTPIGDDTLVINFFDGLTVNLTDPNAEWTLNAGAVLDINAPGGMLAGSNLQGSDFNMAGMATISGNSIWGARTDISGTVDVAAAGSLNLRGGDLTAANVNRLEGGTITGAGALRALVDEGLYGFGAIETDIEFAGNTELRADNGTLELNAPIVDVGVIGTADTDGILDVAAAWNTNVSNFVQMVGGEIRGATITNDAPAGINGHGLLSARIINNTRIDAEGGGTLVVDTAANNNDWDGAGNGVLQAASADLELVDDATFVFSGDVVANNGFEVFANGFQLDFAAGSSLSLAGGTFRSTHATRLAGAIQSNAAPSTLAIDGTALLKNTSVTTLNSDLLLDNTITSVEAGAAFSGGGALVNLLGSELTLADGADVGVLLENRGILEINAGTDGRADVDDYQQSVTGQLNIDLAGTGLNDFDRLVIDGAAQIAGALDLALIGVYVPSPADPPLTILSATGGVSGTFTAVNQPATMPAGLLFDVIYTATMVQLDVVNAPIFSADFDLDGDVDGDDLAEWQGDFDVNDVSDADNDGDSDGADFLAWQQQFGSVPAVATAAAVPEPSSAALLALGMVAIAAQAARRR